MEPKQKDSHQPFPTILKEILHSLSTLLKNELNLVQAEVRLALKESKKDTLFVAGFAIVVVLGLLPFFAFLVLGLGQLFNGRYWLSSLVVSLLCWSIGGLTLRYYTKKMANSDFLLPHTRESLRFEANILKNKVQSISRNQKRNAS